VAGWAELGVTAAKAGLIYLVRSVITVATLGALVTLSGAFAVVVEALNLVYDTPEQRSWVRRRLLGLVLGVITPAAAVLALAALVVGPLLGTDQNLAELVGLGPTSPRSGTSCVYRLSTQSLCSGRRRCSTLHRTGRVTGATPLPAPS
jgi:hypothetical protein